MKPKPQKKPEKVTERRRPSRWHEMNRKQRREMMRKMQSEDLSLDVVHPNAAGIDMGNEPTMWQSRLTATANRCDVSAAPQRN